MAKFYGLPSRDCPTRNDLSQETSSESSSIESLLEIPLELMSRADLAGSVGDDQEDVALTASLVKVVLDCEVHAHGRAYLRSFEISDDTLALDVINQVGPGGNFLGERHTVEHFRREFFSRKPSDPFILDPGPKGSLLDRAKAKVREILSAHQPFPIEESVHREMMRILREAEKDIV